MRNAILAWYAFSESGSAGPAKASPRPTHRLADPRPEPLAIDLNEPAHVAGLFGDARLLDAQVDARGWKHLFSRYGLEGLIDLAKQRGGWPDATGPEVVAEAIVSESVTAGYDPVSGLIGEVCPETGRFEPAVTSAGRLVECDKHVTRDERVECDEYAVPGGGTPSDN